MSSLEDRIAKYGGKAGRYIWLLERELERRRTKRRFLLLSLTMNAALSGILIFLMAHS